MDSGVLGGMFFDPIKGYNLEFMSGFKFLVLSRKEHTS